MYDELVKRLHRCAAEAAVVTDAELMIVAREAADAIEELSTIGKPITNGDKLRAMTDEELAKFLDLVRGNKDYPLYYTDWLDWLRQENEHAKSHRG